VLSIGDSPLNYLLISREAPSVSMTVSNSGDGAAGGVTSTVELPDGLVFAPVSGGAGQLAVASATRLAAFVNFATTGMFKVDGWQCTLDSLLTTATCELDQIEPGASATLELGLEIVADSLADDAVTTFAVAAGEVTANYSVHTGLSEQDNGLDPYHSTRGNAAVTQIGAPVLGCDLSTVSCQGVMSLAGSSWSSQYNNNAQTMVQLNPAGGVTNSGTTTLTLPEDAMVTQALFEWSSVRNVQGAVDAWTTEPGSAKLRAPAGEYVSITADATSTLRQGQREYYVSRANVTDLVAAAGPGTYAAADIAVAATRNDPDPTYYGGFTLTVVYESATEPEATIVVLSGPHWIGAGTSVDLPFFTDVASTASLSITAWEGDRALGGDRVSIDGTELSSIRGDNLGQLGNASDSTARGSAFANTLGVDAKDFEDAQVTEGLHRITIESGAGGDQFLLSTLVVTLYPTD
jgi:hypothetical protein